GLGLVGLFALLVAGHFFSDLTAVNAVLLFAAPLLCWAGELPGVRRGRSWLRTAVQLALVTVPLTLAVLLAARPFVGKATPTRTGGLHNGGTPWPRPTSAAAPCCANCTALISPMTCSTSGTSPAACARWSRFRPWPSRSASAWSAPSTCWP